jgi:aminoglycoside phosphotransferase (APT) family kinase protein
MERAMQALSIERPKSFRTPKLLDAGVVGGWSYVATEPIPPGPHRPARLRRTDRRRIIEEIQARLKDAGIGEGDAVAVHGDFGPWNVRQLRSGITVIDWEELTTGPEKADEIWYLINTAVIGHRGPDAIAKMVVREAGPNRIEEAASFCLTRFTTKAAAEIDQTIPRARSLARRSEEVVHVLEHLLGFRPPR